MSSFTNRIPTVIHSEGLRERAYDLYSLLLKERIVFLGSAIDEQVANSIVAQLLYLQREEPQKEIQMFIHSPGGHAYAGMAIYDTMQQLSAPIRTVAVGLTASFGTILLAAGAPGRRYALANATIHMHQPLGGAQGQATDIQIQAEEVLRLRRSVEEILAQHSGRSQEQIRQDIERDVYMAPQVPLVYVSEPLVWEYKQLLFDLQEEEAPHEEALNELGVEGWELAATAMHDNYLIYTFKRLVT